MSENSQFSLRNVLHSSVETVPCMKEEFATRLLLTPGSGRPEDRGLASTGDTIAFQFLQVVHFVALRLSETETQGVCATRQLCVATRKCLV